MASRNTTAQVGVRITGGTRRAVYGVVRSLLTKLVLLAAVFAAVPVFLYGQFRDAYNENQALIEKSVAQQGRLVTRALGPVLADLANDEISPAAFEETLNQLAGDNMIVRILFRPNALSSANDFYFVAASPTMTKAQLTGLRRDLLRQRILARLAPSCDDSYDDVTRYQTAEGTDEIITSMSAVNTQAGCWVVIASLPGAQVDEGLLDTPYWRRPEAKSAAMIYVAMAIVTLSLLIDVWSNLRRFGRLAHRVQRIGTSHHNPPSFAALNQVPELGRVADEFDRMVAALRNSARALRRAAEDNTHALKTPIAVIRQSLEPIVSTIPREHQRGRGALSRIDNALNRLDGLVSAARRLDESGAQLINPPRHRIDLANLVEDLASEHAAVAGRRGIRLTVHIRHEVTVLAGRSLLETVLENLLENAIGFTPPGGRIGVTLRQNGAELAELVVEDNGPGVRDKDLPMIFQRYYTKRGAVADANSPTGGHQGIGLWVVRRNVEAIGGTARAEHRPGGGLRVILAMPLAPRDNAAPRGLQKTPRGRPAVDKGPIGPSG